MNINGEYRNLLTTILRGSEIAPRGMPTKEIMGFQTLVPMAHPFVTCPSRKIGKAFRFAEAAWILSGDNRVETIAPYSKAIPNFSDDGVRYFGSYGPKIVDQLAHVTASLRGDPDTRQAVINIWRENPRGTKDVPCTLSLQFLQRANFLHCIATMRSSDAWLGWPYDVFNFSCVAKAVCLELAQTGGPRLELGMLRLTAGSQHLYERNYQDAIKVINETESPAGPFNLNDGTHETVSHFVHSLWECANVANEKIRPANR